MENTNGMLLSGQWYGSYTYGPSYGEKVDGERVNFSFLLEADGNEFHGKCIELEGVGASTEVSLVFGSFDGRNICFKKEYETNTYLDDNGSVHEHAGDWIYELTYTGKYISDSNSFAGDWEIREKATADSTAPDILYGSGKWEMNRG